jgi:hypothetical protein
MEPIVQAAVISGTAVIAAAGIQAAGNVVAARKRLAEKPDPKEMAHEVITDRRIKIDWAFWWVLAFMTFWWVLAMATADIMGSRYMLSLVILTPSAAFLMVMAKVLRMVFAIIRR